MKKTIYLFVLIVYTQVSHAQNNSLIGTWQGNGETVSFAKNEMDYQGQKFQCSFTENIISIQTNQGVVQFEYLVEGKYLTLISNGQSVIYSKTADGSSQTNGVKSVNSFGGGEIDQSLVGKWCYVNVNSTNSGGSSSSECITFYANGTYEYYSESSRSVNTSDYYGGTNSQSADQGTWKVQGSSLIANSKSQGVVTYTLGKVNHPKNGDPMIVIDGRSYVTYYQKNPW